MFSNEDMKLNALACMMVFTRYSDIQKNLLIPSNATKKKNNWRDRGNMRGSLNWLSPLVAKLSQGSNEFLIDVKITNSIM